MYNNFNGYRPSYRSSGGYNRYSSGRGYSNNSNRGSYGNNRKSGKKHSGAKAGNDKHGHPYVRGWNANKTNGLRSFLAVPTSKTRAHKSKSGRVWYNWMVKIQQEGRKEQIVSGLYDEQTRRVIIPELSMVINPNKDYCGTFIKRRN